MFIRLVLVLALVWGLLWWFGKGRRRVRGESQAADRAAAPPPAGTAAPQAMVRCARCGVHLPQADALADATGQLFCGEAHRQRGAAEGGEA